MALYLIILNARHPLRDKLATIITQLGGDRFYRLTDFTRLTTGLLDRLPSDLNLLFLPLSTKTLPLDRRRLIGYPRTTWLLVPSRQWFPKDITGVISSFLAPPEAKKISLVSKEASHGVKSYFQKVRESYRRGWEKLTTTYGATVIGPFEEFLTDRQSPDNRVKVYQEYVTLLDGIARLTDENRKMGQIIPDVDEELIKRLGNLPPSRLAYLIYQILLPVNPEEAEEFLRSANDFSVYPSSRRGSIRRILSSLLDGAFTSRNDEVALWIGRYEPLTVIPDMLIAKRDDLADRMLTMTYNIFGRGIIRPIDNPSFLKELSQTVFNEITRRLSRDGSTPETLMLGYWLLIALHFDPEHPPKSMELLPSTLNYLRDLQSSMSTPS